MNREENKNGLWNLPARGFPDRASAYWEIVAEGMVARTRLDILEIGVYKAALLAGLFSRKDVQVGAYTGVDPYLGDASDAYLGAYWKSRQEADEIWRVAAKIFADNKAELVRRRSHEYYGDTGSKTWDVIIVDGDHRYGPAWWDFHHWFQRVRPGGMMVVDDYGNSDAPEVTQAVNSFVTENRSNIARSGYRVLPFQNSGKEVPISLTVVYFQRVESPVETRTWAYKSPDHGLVSFARRVLRTWRAQR